MHPNFDYNYKNDPNRVGVIRVKDLIYNEYAGDSWAKDLEYYEESKGNI